VRSLELADVTIRPVLRGAHRPPPGNAPPR
jgi:hypothetical protein